MIRSANVSEKAYYISDGVVQVAAGGAQGTGTLTLDGGSVQLNPASNISITNAVAIAAAGGSIDVLASKAGTLTGVMTGVGGLTKRGAGTLALSNGNASFSGGMMIDGGVLAVKATTGTPLGRGDIHVNNGGTLMATGQINQTQSIYVNAGGFITAAAGGTLNSAFTVNSGGTYLTNLGVVGSAITFLPGASVAGTGSDMQARIIGAGVNIEPGTRATLGVINFQDLTLNAGAILNMTLRSSPAAWDCINILSGGTLNMASAGVIVNLFDYDNPSSSFFTNGSFQLFSGIDVVTAGAYLGGNPTQGTLSNLTLGNFNPGGVSGASAVFSMIGPAAASSIWVTIAGVKVSATWGGGGTQSGTDWMDPGAWSGGVPGLVAGQGDSATFDGTVAPGTIGFNNGATGVHLGSFSIDAGNGSEHYTFIGGTGKLVMDNGISQAFLYAGKGANVIASEVVLASPTTVTMTSTVGSLMISGDISSAGAEADLTVTGNGTAPLILTGSNTFTHVTISAGVLQMGNGGATGTLGSGAVVNNGNLVFNRIDSANVSNTISGGGSLTQLGTGTTTLTGAADYSGPTIVSAGVLNFSGGVAHSIASVSGEGGLGVDSGTTLTSDGINMPAGSLTVSGNLVTRSSATAAYTKFAVGLAADVLSGTSKIAASGLTVTGNIDIKNNALIVEAADAASRAILIQQIATTMFGSQITSSSAATNPTRYTVAILDNSRLGAANFGGLPVDSTSVIVTEALKGDANIDGAVNALDLVAWKANFNASNTYTLNRGDFDGDGLVNALDLIVWKANFNASITTYPAPSDGSMGGLGTLSIPVGAGGGAGAVPEPASLAVLALGALGLLARRRRLGA